jgi:DnaJ family protein A protein 2
MPSHGNPFVKGGLYVLFSVEFPKDGVLSDAAVAALREHLPGPTPMEINEEEDAEIVHLDEADVKRFGKGGVQNHEAAYDSDEGEGGPQGVQCQQS